MENNSQRFEIKNKISNIVENSKTSNEILIGIYRMFIPDYDNVKETVNRPKCGFKMWHWIANIITEFEKKQREVFPGFIWIDYGFSLDPNLKNWEVNISECVFIMRPNINEQLNGTSKN